MASSDAPSMSDQLPQPLVNLLERLFGEDSLGDAGLVRDDHRLVAQELHLLDGLGRAVQQLHLVGVADVARIADQRPVPIEEYRCI